MSGPSTACSAASSASAPAACASSRSWTGARRSARQLSVLELQHTCLALGFQGVHRTSRRRRRQLQPIQRNLYETLRRVRPKIPHDLSPRWHGQELASPRSRLRVPSGPSRRRGALLLALFVTLRARSRRHRAVTARSRPCFPHAGLDCAPAARRRPLRRPRRRPQLPRIRAGWPGSRSRSRGRHRDHHPCLQISLFESGKANVRDSSSRSDAYRPVPSRRRHGPLSVVGHTDNRPITTYDSLEQSGSLRGARQGRCRPDQAGHSPTGGSRPKATVPTRRSRPTRRPRAAPEIGEWKSSFPQDRAKPPPGCIRKALSNMDATWQETLRHASSGSGWARSRMIVWTGRPLICIRRLPPARKPHGPRDRHHRPRAAFAGVSGW